VKGFSVFVTLMVILTIQAPLFSAQPANCAAFFRSGQVFITWDEVANGEKYIVYSNTAPITTENIASAVKRIERAQGSAGNKMLEYLGGAAFSTLTPPCTFTRNVITPLADGQSGMADEVDSGVGMIVLTSHQAGSYYYAVTAVTGGVEDKSCSAGNSVGPVEEVVEEPVPVLIWRSSIMLARAYLQYTDVDSFNPTMCNTYAFTYWIGVTPDYNTTSGTLPLELHVDGSPGNMPAVGNDCRYFCEGIHLKVQDNRTWWYGYSQTFPYDTSYLYFAGGPAATSGPVINFTQARIMNMLKWMILREPYYSSRIDTNRIHVLGGSMGGGGTLMFLQNYPDFFAYGRADVPPTNFLEIAWQYTGWLTPIWGLGNNDNIKVGFTGWRSEKLNEKYAGMTVHKWLNLETFLVDNKDVEMPFLGICSGGQDNSVNWPQQGKNYYTNLNATKRGFLGNISGGYGHNCEGNSNDQLLTIRKNHSFMAFSNAHQNAPLPLPDDPLSINYPFNAHFRWSTPVYRVGGYQDQIDSTNRYEIVLASLSGDDTADATPRKLQNFVTIPGAEYIVKNTAVGNTNTIYQIDTITADSLGLVTFPGFSIKSGTTSSGGCRFVMVPVEPVTATGKFANQLGGRCIEVSPNPFNPHTRITVQGAGLDDRCDIRIYGITGHFVDKLAVRASQRSASAVWDATAFPSGIYIVKVATSGSILTKQLILLK